ncbi:hypothetical protein J2S43_002502 [Catenuloplanes nepalensis]|uniref:Secreted protein n=1 Tax=Catenuloplanes nepalensis TaxID=587533 RepID=A0ABT9MRE0_9ACTN|nr:hypothetical protein [Catenuloplanes nepalensis]MDP9793990.1 hypothetical protein [Catenuloplanes nepalensis]
MPGPLHVDVITHAGSAAGELRLEAASVTGRGGAGASLTLPATPGPVSATLHVDSPGPWELMLSDGVQVARIPFVVHAVAMSPVERTVYGGFIAAGVFLAVALIVALAARHIWWAVIPGGAAVGGVAVAVVAALLSAALPSPPTAGDDLDPTVANATDPYAQLPRMPVFSRPPLMLTLRQQTVAVGVPVMMDLDLSDAATGLPADDLVVHDSALMHLMIVSPSGRLEHAHPIRTGPGRFQLIVTPDSPGRYAVTAELARRGGGVQMLRALTGFTATGSGGSSLPSLPLRGGGTVDGVDVQLAMADPVAGSPVTLRARIGAEADLQPWLGMLGHLIVVGPLGEDGAPGAPVWMHSHAMDDGSVMAPMEGMDGMDGMDGTTGMGMVPMAGALGRTLPDETVAAYGPGIGFTLTFPVPGRYRMWLQAEKNYRIITVPLTADVKPAAGDPTPRPAAERTAQVTPDSARVGMRDLTVNVTNRDGTADSSSFLQVQAVLPTMGYASPMLTGVPQGPGRFLLRGAPLMAAGGWQLRISSPGAEPLTVPITVTE